MYPRYHWLLACLFSTMLAHGAQLSEEDQAHIEAITTELTLQASHAEDFENAYTAALASKIEHLFYGPH